MINKTILYIYVILFMSSCSLIIPSHLTDNAFYNIDDASIRLIIKHDSDTLFKTQYDQTYNLPGKYYKLLSTTNKIDTINKLGIQLKFWAKVVMNENGVFYGYCPKNGLLEHIHDLNITIGNDIDTLSISTLLYGDSTLNEFKWRYYNYKKLPYTWDNSPYFKDLNSMIKSLNNGNELGRIPNHDYIFWLDRQILKNITFKPTYLQLKISLVDSTGIKYRHMIDRIKIE